MHIIFFNDACTHVCARLCPSLCKPTDCNPPGSSVHGILQAGILEWVVISFYSGSFQPSVQPCISYVSCIARWVLYHSCHLVIKKLSPFMLIQEYPKWGYLN